MAAVGVMNSASAALVKLPFSATAINVVSCGLYTVPPPLYCLIAGQSLVAPFPPKHNEGLDGGGLGEHVERRDFGKVVAAAHE